MSFADDLSASVDARIRLALLQLLDLQADGSANDAALTDAVNALDFTCSRASLRAHLFWLSAQGAVHTLDLRTSSGLVIATLTEMGRDIALGRTWIAGVQRHSPKGA